MLALLRRLFCFGHVWEYEKDIFTDDEIKVCRKCEKEK